MKVCQTKVSFSRTSRRNLCVDTPVIASLESFGSVHHICVSFRWWSSSTDHLRRVHRREEHESRSDVDRIEDTPLGIARERERIGNSFLVNDLFTFRSSFCKSFSSIECFNMNPSTRSSISINACWICWIASRCSSIRSCIRRQSFSTRNKFFTPWSASVCWTSDPKRCSIDREKRLTMIWSSFSMRIFTRSFERHSS